MITCTFAGHREVFGSCTQKIENALETLIENEDTLYCYVGGMGEFDGFSAAAVRNLKRKYPNKEIRLTLVLPYMQQKLNEYKEYYETSFDDILIPAELAEIHYKRAIPARNRWLVDNSDYLIAMVWRDFGGAYTIVYPSPGRERSPPHFQYPQGFCTFSTGSSTSIRRPVETPLYAIE